MGLLTRAAVTCFVLTLKTVSSLVHICAPLGAEVLLPCILTELPRVPQSVSVYWRDKEDRVLLDIIHSNPYNATQHQTFRGRLQSFPHLYREGNFSVLMRNLQLSDSSCYDCFIPQLRFKETVHLTVSDKCVSKARAPPGPSAGVSRLMPGCLHLTVSLLLLLLLLLRKPS